MTIDEIFNRVRQLPPGMPKVAQELLQAFDRDDDGDNLKDIADKISQDQVITAKVLRLANSAYFGGARNVATLEQAVVLLGVSALRTLVIASSATEMFPDLPGFDKDRFWNHCLTVAGVSRELGRLSRLDANIAFVCGMLHRIGDLLIRMANPSLSADIDSYEEMGADRAESQQKLIGLDYAEVGAVLAQRWDFPVVIQSAIHHQLEPQGYPESDNYAAVLAVAAHLVSATEQGLEEDDDGFYPQATAQLLGLDRDRVMERLESVIEKSDGPMVAI